MFQKGEYEAAGAFLEQFDRSFPKSPLAPDVLLLHAMIDLKSCQFDRVRAELEELVRVYKPIEAEVATLLKDPGRRRVLYKRLLSKQQIGTARDPIVELLKIDPKFYRYFADIVALDREAGQLPARDRRVGRADGEADGQGQRAARPARPCSSSRTSRPCGPLAQGRSRDGGSRGRPADGGAARGAAREHAGPLRARRPRTAQALSDEARALRARLVTATSAIAEQALLDLDARLREMLRQARLTQIDAVIGKKKKLEIEISNLREGRYPPDMFAASSSSRASWATTRSTGPSRASTGRMSTRTTNRLAPARHARARRSRCRARRPGRRTATGASRARPASSLPRRGGRRRRERHPARAAEGHRRARGPGHGGAPRGHPAHRGLPARQPALARAGRGALQARRALLGRVEGRLPREDGRLPGRRHAPATTTARSARTCRAARPPSICRARSRSTSASSPSTRASARSTPSSTSTRSRCATRARPPSRCATSRPSSTSTRAPATSPTPGWPSRSSASTSSRTTRARSRPTSTSSSTRSRSSTTSRSSRRPGATGSSATRRGRPCASRTSSTSPRRRPGAARPSRSAPPSCRGRRSTTSSSCSPRTTRRARTTPSSSSRRSAARPTRRRSSSSSPTRSSIRRATSAPSRPTSSSSTSIPRAPTRPTTRARIVEAYQLLGDTKTAVAEMRKLAGDYGAKSPWAAANKDRPKAVQHARTMAEELIRNLAKTMHAEAQAEREDRPRSSTRTATRAPPSPTPSTCRTSPTRPTPSSCATCAPTSSTSSSAATRRRAATTWPSASRSPSASTTRTRSCRPWAPSRRCGARPAAPAASATITESDRLFGEAADTYATLFPKDKEIVTVVFKNGQFFFDYGDYDEAIKRFGLIVEKYPDDPNAGVAGDRILEALNKAKDYENIESWARRLKKTKAFSSRDEQDRLDKVVVNAVMKSGEKYASDGQNEKAASFYLRVAAGVPAVAARAQGAQQRGRRPREGQEAGGRRLGLQEARRQVPVGERGARGAVHGRAHRGEHRLLRQGGDALRAARAEVPAEPARRGRAAQRGRAAREPRPARSRHQALRRVQPALQGQGRRQGRRLPGGRRARGSKGLARGRAELRGLHEGLPERRAHRRGARARGRRRPQGRQRRRRQGRRRQGARRLQERAASKRDKDEDGVRGEDAAYYAAAGALHPGRARLPRLRAHQDRGQAQAARQGARGEGQAPRGGQAASTSTS